MSCAFLDSSRTTVRARLRWSLPMADRTRCPYCRAGWTADNAAQCPGCGLVSHRDCWIENGGCAVLGCSESPHDGPPAALDPASGAELMANEPAATGLPPAGWHPDPHDPSRLRWWDGTEWTAHVHPG